MSQTASKEQPDNTAKWEAKLRDAELPVMTQVIKELNSLLNNPNSSARQVAAVIMRDASLTAKVLKVANSVMHMGTVTETVSISQSVVKLGLRGIKSLCISVMLLESLLRRPNCQKRLLLCLTRAFHAAIQARMLYGHHEEVSLDEEVFVAALLRHLGEMLFWSFPSDALEQFGEGAEDEALSIDEIGARLGIDFDALTALFAQQWQLGDLLLESLQADSEISERAQAVVLGDDISEALMHGWKSSEFREVVASVAKRQQVDELTAFESIRQGVDETLRMASYFAADDVCDLIQAQREAIDGFLAERVDPDLHAPDVSVQPNSDAVERPGAVDKTLAMQPDLQQQLVVLDQLWVMIGRQCDINGIFNMLVDGMHHSIGMERVVIAVANPERTEIVAKYLRGDGCGQWRQWFKFSIKQPEDNILSYCLHKNEPIWVCDSYTPSLMHLVTAKMKKVTGEVREFVAAPIYSKDKPVAVLYADRGDSGVIIAEAQYQSFCRFAQQASVGLNVLAQ